MTNAVANLANTLAKKLGMGEVGNELIVTLKQTAFKGEATDAQFTALMVVANQYGLNPWTREIYAFPDKQNGIVPVVGIDGWSRIINEHKQFDGMDFQMSEDGGECTCTIYRKDRAHPIRVTEYFAECNRPAFKNKQGYEIKGAWQSHPRRMLRHKAMIQCARLAFGYTGIVDEDEAERITEKDVTAEGSHQNKITKEDPKYYTDEAFNALKEKIVGYFKKGHDLSKVRMFIESKGTLITDNQIEELEIWQSEATQPIEGELVEDDFVKEMEAAEHADN